MVFKGRFFSKKSSDSSDGSNSPRRFHSPSRSEKKKGKAAEKDKDKDKDKGKETLTLTLSPGRESRSTNSASPSASASASASASVSPILASSLGLNKIKTRSGPLPQESFLGFRAEKPGLSIGASNLSRGQGGGDSGGKRNTKNMEKETTKGAEGGGELEWQEKDFKFELLVVVCGVTTSSICLGDHRRMNVFSLKHRRESVWIEHWLTFLENIGIVAKN